MAALARRGSGPFGTALVTCGRCVALPEVRCLRTDVTDTRRARPIQSPGSPWSSGADSSIMRLAALQILAPRLRHASYSPDATVAQVATGSISSPGASQSTSIESSTNTSSTLPDGSAVASLISSPVSPSAFSWSVTARAFKNAE